MNHTRLELLYRAVALCSVIASPAIAASTSCENLKALKLANTRITIAQPVAPGAFRPPAVKLDFSGSIAPYQKLPAFCRVAGVLAPTPDSDIKFEVWMPASGWNHKLEGVGNGGFAGSMPYPSLALPVSLNYAAAGTDTGHTGIDASWAPGHPEKVVDFGYRAIHETAVAAKAILKAFYGEGPKYSYFAACSNGGRQALMEAQRYPDDYDGIIAGAPASFWTHHFASFIWNLDALIEPGAYIPVVKLNAIEAAALAACDAADGVKDGVINNPLKCHFDPGTLLCKGPETLTCLTAPQLTALRKIYAGPKSENGEQIFPGLYPGAEAQPGGWSVWVTGYLPTMSLQAYLGAQFFGSMVLEKPFWSFLDFDVDRDVKIADKKLAAILNATNPNLKPFLDRGGKLILYQGWTDAAVPPQNTINYYESVVKTMDRQNADRFVRLFMVPGMQHCGDGPGTCFFGQTGAGSPHDAEHDINLALEQWVERGVAPDVIIASRPLPGGATRTRPLCAYPKVARWKGTGSTDDAANFTCTAEDSR